MGDSTATKDISTSSAGGVTLPAFSTVRGLGLIPQRLIGPGVSRTIDALAGAHNKVNRHPSQRADPAALRAVYRRGAGSWSRAKHPGRTRRQHGMARVRAHLATLATGTRPSGYAGDGDLLPVRHPLRRPSTKSLAELFASEGAPDAAMLAGTGEEKGLAKWDSHKHPRDHDGRFIHIGAHVAATVDGKRVEGAVTGFTNKGKSSAGGITANTKGSSVIVRDASGAEHVVAADAVKMQASVSPHLTMRDHVRAHDQADKTVRGIDSALKAESPMSRNRRDLEAAREHFTAARGKLATSLSARVKNGEKLDDPAPPAGTAEPSANPNEHVGADGSTYRLSSRRQKLVEGHYVGVVGNGEHSGKFGRVSSSSASGGRRSVAFDDGSRGTVPERELALYDRVGRTAPTPTALDDPTLRAAHAIARTENHPQAGALADELTARGEPPPGDVHAALARSLPPDPPPAPSPEEQRAAALAIHDQAGELRGHLDKNPPADRADSSVHGHLDAAHGHMVDARDHLLNGNHAAAHASLSDARSELGLAFGAAPDGSERQDVANAHGERLDATSAAMAAQGRMHDWRRQQRDLVSWYAREHAGGDRAQAEEAVRGWDATQSAYWMGQMHAARGDEPNPPGPPPGPPPEVAAALRAIPDKGKPDATGDLGDPIAVGGDLERAAQLLAEGKHVRLEQPDELATLIGKVDKIVQAAKKRGETAPSFDFCKVSVPGTNLFCQQSRGIPRAQMPQLKGAAVEGSYAAGKGGAGNEVDVEPEFLQMLQDVGIKATPKSVLASHLRASQSELNGAKVAGMADVIASGSDKGRAIAEGKIFTTRDGYVIDGHHRWAAMVAQDIQDGQLGNPEDNVRMNVVELDMDIGRALDMTNEFARRMGIAQAAVGAPERKPGSQGKA